MSQLAHIKQKIKTIQTTKKITHAVRLISMSFYNKLDKLNKPLREYSASVQDAFLTILAAAPQWQHPIFTPSEELDTDLCILVSTTKGLCGSLNSNLFRFLQQYTQGSKKKNRFIAVGGKALVYLRSQGYEIAHYYPEVTSNNYVTITDDITDKLMNQSNAYGSVLIFSSVATSFFSQKPQRKQLIPLTVSAQALLDSGLQEYIWEQSQPDLANYTALLYFKSNLMTTLFQAIRAEQAARFLAMENSTNNAEKILARLTLHYNKLRQDMITKELSELAAGALVHADE